MGAVTPSGRTREKVLALIQADPGVHAESIARAMDLSVTAIRFHLAGLQRDGEVLAMEQDGKRGYFHRGAKRVADKRLHLLLRDRRRHKLAETLVGHPGSTLSDLAYVIESHPTVVHRALNGLVQEGYVVAVQEGASRCFFPTADLEAGLGDVHETVVHDPQSKPQELLLDPTAVFFGKSPHVDPATA